MIKKLYSMGGRFAAFSEATLAPLWNLLARIYLFIVFYRSAILKVKDILSGNGDRVTFLFEHEYGMPFANIIGPLASFTELICAFLVLVGLFSRLSAFILLCMAVYIQFGYVEHISHVLWMFLASYVVVYGGSRLSVDTVWCKTIGTYALKESKSGNSYNMKAPKAKAKTSTRKSKSKKK